MVSPLPWRSQPLCPKTAGNRADSRLTTMDEDHAWRIARDLIPINNALPRNRGEREGIADSWRAREEGEKKKEMVLEGRRINEGKNEEGLLESPRVVFSCR